MFALLEMSDTLNLTLDAGHNAVLILLSLSAAFDIVSHEVLLHRLRECAVDGQAWAWLESFLTNWHQTV